MKIALRAAAAAGIVVLLAGCDTTGTMEDTGGPEVVDKGVAAGTLGRTDSSTTALPGRGDLRSLDIDDPNSILATRVIYFEYDSSTIAPEDQAVIDAHAQYLASHPSASVSLEGHADERGSREYNIGLGDRRGQGVRQALTLLGASDGQIQIVSYGEERPAIMGHDEAAYSRNRRVEIVYLSK